MQLIETCETVAAVSPLPLCYRCASRQVQLDWACSVSLSLLQTRKRESRTTTCCFFKMFSMPCLGCTVGLTLSCSATLFWSSCVILASWVIPGSFGQIFGFQGPIFPQVFFKRGTITKDHHYDFFPGQKLGDKEESALTKVSSTMVDICSTKH